ncbi:unnamed protein product [Mytilus edulis]|uniref:B box-type domain-containing protein n=1 Tax=Mytilus edulis TaxID=6550 RepID=A0A8S3V7K2_MYTED|nr:unnamed protein product [Mytilus edulis]
MASNTFCGPCSRKEASSSALSWCSDCEEPLCKECVDAHRVIKVSAGHHVVDMEHALSVPGAITTSQQYCDNHTDLFLDLFCTYHDALCCRACMTEYHRNCETIVPIDIASKDIKDSTLLTDLSEELDNIIISSKQIANVRKKHSDSILEQENTLRQTIKKAKDNVIAYVEKLERSLMNDLKERKDAQQAELQAEKEAMLNMEKEAEELQRQISYTTTNGSKKQVFLLLHKVKTGIANMDQRIEKTIRTMHKPILQFKESNSGFTFREQLGNIQLRNDTCSITYNSPKLRFAQVLPDPNITFSTLEFENKFDVDTSPQMQITGMTATKDGKLLLCNYRNNSILEYDLSGTFSSSCPLFGAPWDITTVPDEKAQAVTTMPKSSSIRFINAENLKPGKAVELPGNCYGIVATKDKILVGGINEFYILTTEGTHQTTVKVKKPTRMWYMNVVNGNLIYSDQNKVFCVNLEGQEVFVYSSPGLSRPMAIAMDHKSNLYIPGCHSNNIHRVSSNGSYVDTVLGQIDNISNPWAICFDHNSGKLVFANDDGKTICVFKCK